MGKFGFNLGELVIGIILDVERRGKVENYVFHSGDYDWEKEIGKYLPKQHHSLVATKVCPFDESEGDRLTWRLTSTSTFSAISAYKLIYNNN